METSTTLTKRSGYNLEEDYAPIFKGKVQVPNFEEMTLELGVAAIAAGGGLIAQSGVQNAKIPGSNSSWGHWARYFLSSTQGGALDGVGYVMFYDHGKGRVGRFAICKHEKIEGPGANHSLGWHPGHCGKCGLNMSVDSGD